MRFTSTSPNGSGAAVVRPMDVAALLWTLLFFGWLAFDWLGPRWAPVVDVVFFTPLGVAVGIAQLAVARRVAGRERAAWYLLAASSFLRFVSGTVWGIWSANALDDVRPVWLVALTSAYLPFLIAGLLAFAGVRWRRADRVRRRCTIGSIRWAIRSPWSSRPHSTCAAARGFAPPAR